METFSALLAFCVGNSPVTAEFPTQRPVTRSFEVFFDLDSWANNGDAGGLRRYRAHYDVIVMIKKTVRTNTLEPRGPGGFGTYVNSLRPSDTYMRQ